MKSLKINAAVVMGFVLTSCNFDKKPDAIVLKNEALEDSVATVEIEPTDTLEYLNDSVYFEETDSVDQIRNTSGTAAPKKNVKRTRTSVQRMLTRDAKLATTMPLQRYAQYMKRKQNQYRGFGEMSYEDKTVKIKITDEEMKIETPEGKLKIEPGEMKIKTDDIKIKKETRD